MTKLSNSYISILFLLLFGLPAIAQNGLFTPDQAIQTTLSNNYNLQLARNTVQLATNNTNRQLNGYYPTFNFNLAPNANLGSSTQQFSNGGKNSFNNALAWGANASVQADYFIYDKVRDLTLEQLKENLNLTNLQLRQEIELNVLDVLTAYYQLAQLNERVNLQQETIDLSRRRQQRAQYRFDYGQGNRLDILNAQVDIQRDTIALINLEQQIANAERNLNFLIGRDINTAVEIDTSITYLENPNFQNLLQRTLQDNIQLLVLQQNRELIEYDLQINEASRRPTLSSTASYNFTYQNNPEGAFITSSNSRGLNVGLNVRWNIYDGGVRNIQEQNIKLNAEALVVQRDQLEQQLLTNLSNAWETYQNALFILSVERENLRTNELNFERTEEQFRAGQINSVEFRQAQLNLLTAASNLNAAKYDAKIAELELLQLSGQLLDE